MCYNRLVTPEHSPDYPDNYSTALVDMELNDTATTFDKYGRYLELAQLIPRIIPDITCSITRLDRSEHRSELNTQLRMVCAAAIGSVLIPVEVLLELIADHFQQKADEIQESYLTDAGGNINDSGEPRNDNGYDELLYSESSLTESVVDFIRGVGAATRIIFMDYFNRFRE